MLVLLLTLFVEVRSSRNWPGNRASRPPFIRSERLIVEFQKSGQNRCSLFRFCIQTNVCVSRAFGGCDIAPKLTNRRIVVANYCDLEWWGEGITARRSRFRKFPRRCAGVVFQRFFQHVTDGFLSFESDNVPGICYHVSPKGRKSFLRFAFRKRSSILLLGIIHKQSNDIVDSATR